MERFSSRTRHCFNRLWRAFDMMTWWHRYLRTTCDLWFIQRFSLVFAALVVLPSLMACAQLQHTQTNPDQEALITALQSHGTTIQQVGAVQQPFFHTQGTRLCISGAQINPATQVQVYAYNDAGTAEMDVHQISRNGATVVQRLPNGNSAMTSSNWIAPPHFFQRDRVVVLYLGSNQALLELLSEALGPQIAGESAQTQWMRSGESC